ncbi:hypothetical protein JMG10_16105 [Nostoc ellipsosporum NOK]|nr:hypothetical protein [Nostoc ellipsosporum NOK]
MSIADDAGGEVQKTLSYRARRCHAPPMTNAFLANPAAPCVLQRGETPACDDVATFATFRAEI